MLLTHMAWSMIYVEMKRMTMPKIFSELVRRFWNEWELRLMLLLSLNLQLLLVYVGRGRVNYTGLNFTILAWTVYLLADWAATVVLSSLLRGSIDLDKSLVVLWTPFLLWHLGSPFNITAYSLEDNEIWLRHFLAMIIQSTAAIYICLRFWTDSVLAFMSVPVLISGIFKYGERIWALRAASEKRLVESIFDVSMRHMNNDVIGQKMIRTGMISGETEDGIEGALVKNVQRLDNLRLAHYSYCIFKPLFADLHFEISKETSSDIDISSKSPEDAFELAEIELRFLYDTLYTKVPLQQSSRFIAFHSFCFFSAVAALIAFTFVIGKSVFLRRVKYDKVDIAVTYLLLVSAIALDIYSAVVLSVSNWTMVRWSKKPRNFLQRLYVKFVAGSARKRVGAERARGGSKDMAQHDLVNYFVEKRQANLLNKSAGILDTGNLLQKYRHTRWEAVTPELKKFIFSSILEKYKKMKNSEMKNSEPDRSGDKNGESTYLFLEEDIRNFLQSKGFIERVFIWHIATNLLYYSDNDMYPPGTLGPHCEISRRLSNYMMYLVLMKPTMLPRGFNEVINRETCKEATQLFPRGETPEEFDQGGFRRTRKVFISSLLGLIQFTNAPVLVQGKKMSALLDGCFLANQLKLLVTQVVSRRYDQEEKWEMVSLVWMEMMSYAASKCAWREHAKELIHGGELLSYVSLLMAHLGLTEDITVIEPDRLRDFQSRLQ